MAKVMIVRVPFSRGGKDYWRGDIIADPAVLDDIRGTSHEPHGHRAALPDDHPAVAPFLSSAEVAPASRKRATVVQA